MKVNAQLPAAFKELFKPSRYKAYYGGRGSGKSHSMAFALLVLGMKKPLRILCAREVQLSIKDSVKSLLDDLIKKHKLETFFESTLQEIKGRNGTTFIFSGLGRLTSDQLKSYEGVDIAFVDESQTISSQSLETLIPTIRKAESELWFSWNPRSASDPVDQRFRGPNPPPNSIIRKVNYDDNPFFPPTLKEERLFDYKAIPHRYPHIWLGEYELNVQNSIWNRENISSNRRSQDSLPSMERIYVAIDPAISNTTSSDEHGIVVCGLGEDERGYVLEDGSLKGSPRQWADRAISLLDRFDADGIIIEINQGGDMCKHTLQSVRSDIHIVDVRATRGKHLRAEPISALYSLNKISHVGSFPELENQLCHMTSAGYEGEGSPDRVDALVYAFTELFPQLTRPRNTVNIEIPMPAEGGWMS